MLIVETCLVNRLLSAALHLAKISVTIAVRPRASSLIEVMLSRPSRLLKLEDSSWESDSDPKAKQWHPHGRWIGKDCEKADSWKRIVGVKGDNIR